MKKKRSGRGKRNCYRKYASSGFSTFFKCSSPKCSSLSFHNVSYSVLALYRKLRKSADNINNKNNNKNKANNMQTWSSIYRRDIPVELTHLYSVFCPMCLAVAILTQAYWLKHFCEPRRIRMACHSVERRSSKLCPVCNLSCEPSWRWGQWAHVCGLRWKINVMFRCSLCGTRRRDLDFWHYERWGRGPDGRWTVYLGHGW